MQMDLLILHEFLNRNGSWKFEFQKNVLEKLLLVISSLSKVEKCECSILIELILFIKKLC